MVDLPPLCMDRCYCMLALFVTLSGQHLCGSKLFHDRGERHDAWVGSVSGPLGTERPGIVFRLWSGRACFAA